MTRICAVALACAVVAGCGTSPTQPWPFDVTQTGPAILGSWEGRFEITACTGPLCATPPNRGFSLSLAQRPPFASADIEGQLVLHDGVRPVVSLVGARGDDGFYHFSTAHFTYPGEHRSTIDVRDLVLREDPATGLSGSFTVITNPGTGETFTSTAVVRSATHVPGMAFTAERFDGTWNGYYVYEYCLEGCETGFPEIDDAQGGPLVMSLSQTGNTVAGLVAGASISGQIDPVDPSHLEASGARLNDNHCPVCPGCVGFCEIGVTNFHAQIDKLGRLSGSFFLERKSWNGEEHHKSWIIVKMTGVRRGH